MFKKLASTVLLFLILSSSRLHANECCPQCYHGGFNLGVIASHESVDLESFLTVGYFNDYFLANFGANYEHIHFGPVHRKLYLWSFLGQLGLRYRLCNNVFLSYGAIGISENKKVPKLRYSVGAFVGLDYQISRHFFISAKIDPFLFIHSDDSTRFYEYFETGSLHVAYVF